MIRYDIARPFHRKHFPRSTFMIVLKGCEVFSIFRTVFDDRGFDSRELVIRDFINEEATPAKAMRKSLSKRFLTLVVQWFCSDVKVWYILFPFVM